MTEVVAFTEQFSSRCSGECIRKDVAKVQFGPMPGTFSVVSIRRARNFNLLWIHCKYFNATSFDERIKFPGYDWILRGIDDYRCLQVISCRNSTFVVINSYKNFIAIRFSKENR